jgi:Uma2 family endonuclease
MSTAERLLTADEFEQLDEPEAGGKLELDEGRLIQHMPVNAEHGMLQLAIGSPLRTFARENDLGSVMVETAFRLFVPGSEGDTVRAPDVAFVPRTLADDERRAPSLPFAPHLAIEVISPSDRDAEVQRKVRQYLAAGVERVWVVRPEDRTVTVHRPDGDAHTYTGTDALRSDDAGFRLDGFALSLSDIFGG